MGFTAWRNDVTIVWNATILSLYNRALSLYSSKQYEKAMKLFKEVDGYSNSSALLKACQSAIKKAQQEKTEKAKKHIEELAEYEKSVGKEPSAYLIICGGCIVFLGLLFIIALVFSTGGLASHIQNAEFIIPLSLVIIGVILIVWYIIAMKKHIKKTVNYSAKTYYDSLE